MQRGYYVCSKTPQGRALFVTESKDTTEIVVFGLYGAEGRYVGLFGDTNGECTMYWRRLQPGEAPIPFLEVSQGSWFLFEQGRDIFERLAGMKSEEVLSPQAFCQILQQCGCRDLSQEAEGNGTMEEGAGKMAQQWEVEKIRYWREELFPRYGATLLIQDGWIYAVKEERMMRVMLYQSAITEPYYVLTSHLTRAITIQEKS